MSVATRASVLFGERESRRGKVRSKGYASFVRAWILRCGLAELVGIGLAATAVVVLSSRSSALAFYFVCLAIGAVEGGLIGLAQGSLLRGIFPQLDLARFVGLTALVAIAGWAIGMAPSTFFEAESTALSSTPPSMLVVLAISAVGGGLGGLLIALAQALELRRHTHEMGRWILASMVGWMFALPLDVVGASIPTATTPPVEIIAMGGGFGLLAGAAFAIPTGLIALRWKRSAKSARA